MSIPNMPQPMIGPAEYHALPEKPVYFVGTLSRWDPQTGQSAKSKPIYSNKEMYVGRGRKKCEYVIDDPFVSKTHLRIYTVIFDQDDPSKIAPLVYAQDISMNGTLWNDYPMGKADGGRLLSNGDTLKVTPGICLKFECPQRTEESHFDRLQTVEMKVFENEYVVTERQLGVGAYGKVHMAFNKATGQQLACKIVNLRALRDRALQEAAHETVPFFYHPGVREMTLRQIETRKLQEKLDVYHREAEILGRLCHPNIISLEKVIKTNNTIYLFQDLVTAGDLFSFIYYKGGKLTDIESAVIIRQVLVALDYLHDRNIVHRDLKPDNILMTSLADGCRVVLTDFGCARILQPTDARMSTMVGTSGYSAPEVFNSHKNGYTKAVDMWSLGCVTLALLTGESASAVSDALAYSPEKTHRREMKKIKAKLDLNNVGERAKDFVLNLLVHDETKRMGVKEALQHCWFTNPAHKEEFESLYQRSIKDWKPHNHKGRYIVNLSTLMEINTGPNMIDPDQLRSAEAEVEQQSDLRVRYSSMCSRFPALSDGYTTRRYGSLTDRYALQSDSSSSSSTSSDSDADRTPRQRPRHFSQTLSDPGLPQHDRTIGKPEGKELGVSDSSQKGKDSVTGFNATKSSAQESSSGTDLPMDNKKKDAGSDTNKGELTELTELSIVDKPAGEKHPQSSAEVESEDESEDEVYEEINNSVTGKRQNMFYGENIFNRLMEE